MSERPLTGWSYWEILDWDEDKQGPMPDEYDTECPQCFKRFPVWHAVNYVTCDCGCLFDPSTEERVRIEIS